MKKILDILPYIPYPLYSGGNQAVFNMLEAMVKEYEVHLLLRVKTDKDLELIEGLHNALPDLVIHISKDNTPEYTLFMHLLDYLRKSLHRKLERRIVKKINESKKEKGEINHATSDSSIRKFTTLYNFFTDTTESYLNSVYEVSRMGFDIVQCEFHETVSLVSLLPKDVKKVFVHHELRYARNANEMEFFNEVTPADTYFFHTQKDAEISALRHFDAVVTLTKTDKELLLGECPDLNIYVSPAIVKYEKHSLDFSELGRELVFVGSADHYPNFDGLMWYCMEVSPKLREMGQEPLLHVTGLWQDDKQKAVRETGANVNFVGFVDDLHGFLNGRLSVVPIRIGSGMRMKILDAIDSGSPVVTTIKGCEGLDFKNGEDIIVCDSGEEFAKMINKTLSNKALQEHLVANSRRRLGELFSQTKQTETRLRLYSTLI